jgi:hypothetical protein
MFSLIITKKHPFFFDFFFGLAVIGCQKPALKHLFEAQNMHKIEMQMIKNEQKNQPAAGCNRLHQ